MDTTTTELKSYQELVLDHETGEEIVADKYLYLPGRPREYRYNAQNGQFNLYGERILLDGQGKPLQSLTFQPISYCIFRDTLFERTAEEQFAELYFIDAQNCVSMIMFSNTSVSELLRLLEPLVYERLSLTDVRLTARAEKVTSKSDPTKSWYIARFSYEIAPDTHKAEYADYVNDYAVYRAEIITPSRKVLYAPRVFKRILLNEAYAEFNGHARPNEIAETSQP